MALEYNREEIEAEIVRRKADRVKSDKRVCICGHPVLRHGDEGKGIMWKGSLKYRCQVGKHECGCDEPIPVLEASDPRNFTFRSTGHASFHALMLGIHKANTKDSEWSFLYEPECWNCESKESVSPCWVLPQAGPQNTMLSEFASKYNAFLCKECRISNTNVLLYKNHE